MWKVDYDPGDFNVEYHLMCVDGCKWGGYTRWIRVNQKIHISLPINWWCWRWWCFSFSQVALFYQHIYVSSRLRVKKSELDIFFSLCVGGCELKNPYIISSIPFYRDEYIYPYLVQWEMFFFSHAGWKATTRVPKRWSQFRMYAELLINWLIFSTPEKSSSSWSTSNDFFPTFFAFSILQLRFKIEQWDGTKVRWSGLKCCHDFSILKDGFAHSINWIMRIRKEWTIELRVRNIICLARSLDTYTNRK